MCVFLIKMQNCHIFNDVGLTLTGNIRSDRSDHSRNDIYQIHIGLISTYEREKPESDLRISDSMSFLHCLHMHSTDPICAAWEEKIGIGPLEPCSVNTSLIMTKTCTDLTITLVYFLKTRLKDIKS